MDHNSIANKSDPDRGQNTQNLAQRTLRAIFWTFSGTGFRAILEALILVVLARLLTPRDFGVASAAVVVLKFSDIITQSGIGQAIIQRPNIETRHLRTGFTLSCLTGLLMATMIVLFAEAIAGFFRMQELASILPIVALVFPIHGVSLVADSLLQRDVLFRRLAAIDIASYTLGYGLIGVSLAYLGFGVWALVGAQLMQAASKSAMLLAVRPHPKWPRLDRRSFSELMYFGCGHTLGRIFNSIAGQGDNLVVGRWLGAEALGIYGRAHQLMAMPANLLGMALDRVLFPVMAKMQGEPERLANAYRKGVAVIALMVLPASVMMYELAPQIILVLFGPAWLEVVAPFRILAMGILFRTSYKMSDSLARATGAVYRRAWRQGVYAALVFGGAWVGQFWGLSGVALGIFGAIFVNFAFMAHLSLRITSLSYRSFFSVHLPALLLALIVWAEIAALMMFLRDMALLPILPLALCATTVLITIALLIRLFPNLFLGNDGVHAARTLMQSLPDKYKTLCKTRA